MLNRSTNTSQSMPMGFWHRSLLFEKLRNPTGVGILVLAALIFGVLIGTQGTSIGVILLGISIGMPIVAACVIDLRFGVVFVTTISFFLMEFKKAIDLPFGIFLDAGILLLFLGVMFRQAEEQDWSFAKSPISYAILFWMGINLLELANPAAASRMAWVYTVRGMAGTLLFYYILLYVIRDLRFAIQLIKLVFGLCFFAALWAMYQEFFGLPPWEHRWMMMDIERFKLIYQAGRVRLFSFLSDPTTFGIMMAYMVVFAFALFFGPYRRSRKVFLAIAAVLMMLGCFWSGTRTAYIVIPAGMIVVALCAVAKRQWIIVGLIAATFGGGFVLINIPTSNKTIYRFQTAFKPSQDASFNTRLRTQKAIKSVVQRYPIGGGLGSCGAWGKQFSPHTIFAQIAPDSGYVRVAVELGWVGLIIYMVMLFVMMRETVRGLMRARDPVILNIYLGLTGVVFCLIVANYGQEAITLLPNSIVFYIVLALAVRLKDFDPNYIHDA
jgi:hypothetical protein